MTAIDFTAFVEKLAEVAGDIEERARHLVLMRASDDTDRG
jgi:hypothetical protein